MLKLKMDDRIIQSSLSIGGKRLLLNRLCCGKQERRKGCFSNPGARKTPFAGDHRSLFSLTCVFASDRNRSYHLGVIKKEGESGMNRKRIANRLAVLALSLSVLFSMESICPALTRRDDVTNAQLKAFANEHRYGGFVSAYWLGSGTLISPNWVITAKHLLNSGQANIYFLGASRSSPSNQHHYHPSLDVALMKLNNPITNIEPVSLYDLSFGSEAGQDAVMMGAGYPGSGSAGEKCCAGTRRAGQSRIINASSSFAHTRFRRPGSGALPLEVGGALGDSGGGLVLNVSGEDALAGVQSYTTVNSPQSGYGVQTGYVRTAPLNAWITSIATDAVLVGTTPPPPAVPTCNFNDDLLCDAADLDKMYADTGYDLVSGVSAAGLEQFDLNSDDVVDNLDIDKWLTMAALENDYATSHRRGDTNGIGNIYPETRFVDLFDYSVLSGKFDPLGLHGPHLWKDANFDGDGDIDLADYNSLTGNFNFAGYEPASTTVPEPSSLAICCLALVGAVSVFRSSIARNG
ncbi:MAG: hypothetical protein CMJ81_11515 [Planctomycetaceae bacterium]|nr:hypothetical protein [Planctomycetaceae bacterium]